MPSARLRRCKSRYVRAPRRPATRRPDAMPYFSFLPNKPSGGGFAPPISPPNNRESPGRVRFPVPDTRPPSSY